MKKKIFNLLKLFVLVLALFISFIGMKSNVFAAQSEFVGEPSFVPVHVAGTPSNNESVLVSLKGATVTLPSGWSASANYGIFNISGSIEYHDDNYILRSYPLTSFGIGYDLALDNVKSNCLSFSGGLTAGSFSTTDSGFSISCSGGNDVTNQLLIQWFVDNNATIIGGVYSDDVVSVTNDIGDIKLVWELKWLESTEEIPSDYVEIYPSSDTKQCYIVFKKSFSISMELVVKSEDDESLYASCDVDCYERTETVGSASLSVSLDGSTNSDLLLGQDVEENEITFNGNTSYESIFTDQKIEINSMTATTSKVGTLATTQEVSYNVGLSEELQTLLEDREITFISTTSTLLTSTVKGLLESLITFTDDNKETVYEALNTCDNWFRVDVEVVDKYHDEIINEYLYTINIIGFVINDYFNNSTIPTDLTGYTVSVPSGWSVSAGFGSFEIEGKLFYNNNSGANIGFLGFGYTVNPTTLSISQLENSFTYGLNFDGIGGALSSSSSFSLSITGGNDVTNQSLIQCFANNNATFELIEEETLTFSIVHSSNTYYFPLERDGTIAFVSLNGLYDITNSVYINCSSADSFVYLMPINAMIYENSDGSTAVWGDTFVLPDEVFYVNSSGGGSD